MLPRLTADLSGGKIEPDALRGLIIREKKDEREKLRPLAVPTMRDRFLQRAVLEELGPAAEMLFEDSSFAYRKGLSHQTARQHVAKARREGFTHVLDADIGAFFDQVDWNKLKDRLAGFFGDDPVVDALMAWVKAPVLFEGCLVERDKGLPQGAVVSPLLANLYLDVLDEAVTEAGYRLVRFGDDFVVMAKTKERAAAAEEIVTEKLRTLGLARHRDKTRRTSFAEGFDKRTSDETFLWVVIYNLQDAERGRRLGELLKFNGNCVRPCVYEVFASKTRIDSLLRELAVDLTKDDTVRVYRVCEQCRQGTYLFGDVELPGNPEAIVI